MELKSLNIPGSWLAHSPIWEDERGSFREWFKSADILAATGLDFSAAQANLSESMRGVIRGVHYSLAPVGQAKWITCVTGSIRDVIVDIRPGSRTYGKYEFVDLAGGDGQAVLIGAGLGHGFISKVDGSIVAYLVSSPFSPLEEFEINPFDPDIGIEWGLSLDEITLSSKDRMAPTLSENKSRGKLPSE
jgi:dTDP-4-dehydrorhamnose 3,5-epimerase